MNILMFQVPTKEGEGSVPFGLLCASTIAHYHGNNVKLVDLAEDRLSYTDLAKLIHEFSPKLIGIGGITAGYKSCKELIQVIKRDISQIPIVVGG